MYSFFLFFGSFSLVQPDFDFQSPIIQSNISEVGVWALRGSAINMKKFIRLTSLLANDCGGLCSYQKTLSDDWQINFNFSLLINKLSFSDNVNQDINLKNIMKESSILISYTKELCPESSLSWSGFKFVINITSQLTENIKNENENDKNKIYLTFSVQTNDGTLVGFSNNHKIKSIPVLFSKKKYFFTIKISKEKNNVTFFFLDDKFDNSNEYQNIYSMKTNMTTGYFSLINQVTENKNENFIFKKGKKSSIEILNSLYSIKINQKLINQINETETNLNRKLLSSGFISRSFSKQKRKYLMKKVNFYKEEMEFNNGKLNARENDDFDDDENENNKNINQTYNQLKLKDSFIEINEMIRRADQDLTLDELQAFINQIVTVRLNSALSKIEKISSDLADLKLDLIQTWNNVKDQLLEISVSIHSNFDEIEKETSKSVLDYIAQMNNKNLKNIKIRIPNDLEKDAIIKIMFIICMLEFVGFIIFFLIKRKTTNNWKKID